MKRFHVHVHVDDLAKSIGFYSKLFAAEPARVEADYAKWMLEDPRVNFAISTRGNKPGLDHLGFQVDDADELAVIIGTPVQLVRRAMQCRGSGAFECFELAQQWPLRQHPREFRRDHGDFVRLR